MNYPKVKHPTPTPCACCRQLTPTTRLFKLVGSYLRPLCAPCVASLTAMGMDWRAAA